MLCLVLCIGTDFEKKNSLTVLPWSSNMKGLLEIHDDPFSIDLQPPTTLVHLQHLSRKTISANQAYLRLYVWSEHMLP